MSQSKVLVVVLMVVFLVTGWYGTVSSLINSDAKEYKEHIKQAEDYVARELYQKAAEEYTEAVSIKDSEKLRQTLLNVWQKRYEESESDYTSYLEAATAASLAYPKNEEFISTVVSLYEENEDYVKAYKAVQKCVDAGADSDKVKDLYVKTKYSYKISWDCFTDIGQYTNSDIAVATSEDGWKYLDESGAMVGTLEKLAFASPVGENGIFIYTLDNTTFIQDSDGVVQGKLDFTPVEARPYSENLIAIKNGDNYGYYDLVGDYQFGEYQEASCFTNGKAAVLEDGNWMIIDSTGKKVSDGYEEIKLNKDGSYIKNGVMIAKVDGVYKLFDSNEKVIGDFTCDDIDQVTADGKIAFCKNEKWGFVDTAGTIVIDPQYTTAKSFSNGLAAYFDGSKWGFIDENNEVAITPTFYDADYFTSKGVCLVQNSVDTWYILSLYNN